MVVQGTTNLLSNELLTLLKKIGQQIGRKEPYNKWSPRAIDLDILLWDNYCVDTPDLKIPHSQLLNRSFLVHLIASLSLECRYVCANDNLYKDRTFAEIADLIENQGVIRSLVLKPQFVGILNITPDSFSDGGLSFHKEDAVKNFIHLMDVGSSIIDLGAQSTRPSAFMISDEEEYTRLNNVLEELKGVIEKTEYLISIDTFSPEVIKRILKNIPFIVLT